jgi:bacterioferritin-associated ferredoxin
MYVCICNNITERDIEEAVRLKTVQTKEDLAVELGVGCCCGLCRKTAEELFDQLV